MDEESQVDLLPGAEERDGPPDAGRGSGAGQRVAGILSIIVIKAESFAGSGTPFLKVIVLLKIRKLEHCFLRF